jgi:autotransporter-associated beta strand protein
VLAGGNLRTSIVAPTEPVLTNPVQVVADSSFPTGSGERSLVLAGPLTLFGGTRTLNVSIGQTVAASALVLSGVVGESVPGSGLVKAGAGNLRLTNTNTYTGMTTISGGELLLDSPTGMAVPGSVTYSASSTTLTLSRGEQNGGPAQLPASAVLSVLGTGTMYFNLNNNQATIAGLSYGNAVNGVAVQNAAATVGMGTLILQTPEGQSFTYNGRIRDSGLGGPGTSGTLTLVKRGSGTQIP